MKSSQLSLVLVIALSAAACHDNGKVPSPAAAVNASPPAAVGAPVSKIVFVGQKEACDCTKARIEATSKVLDEALAGRGDIAVERLQLDIDEAKVEELGKLRPLMVAPGIYFFDDKGGLVEMLQGEVAPEDLETVLKGAHGA